MNVKQMRRQVRVRWVLAAVTGVAVGVWSAIVLGIAAGVLCGWAALALVSTLLTLAQVWPMDSEATRAHALIEDPGRKIARIIALLGSIISLAAVLFVVSEARQAHGAHSYLLAGVAVLSVIASWALIQIDYMLRYADVYFHSGGGISFNQDDPPEYTDFAYFSFGLGMTYQVADTSVTSNEIRRIVIGQTMLGYVFGAGILATVINLITSL